VEQAFQVAELYLWKYIGYSNIFDIKQLVLFQNPELLLQNDSNFNPPSQLERSVAVVLQQVNDVTSTSI
ncbi:hypothetical protein QYM36_011400, partial [Artemia franciscana]